MHKSKGKTLSRFCPGVFEGKQGSYNSNDINIDIRNDKTTLDIMPFPVHCLQDLVDLAAALQCSCQISHSNQSITSETAFVI